MPVDKSRDNPVENRRRAVDSLCMSLWKLTCAQAVESPANWTNFVHRLWVEDFSPSLTVKELKLAGSGDCGPLYRR
jgi:hypothetical protein